MIKRIIWIFLALSLIFSGCGQDGQNSSEKAQIKNKKYEICSKKVRVQEIYFKNEKGFQCSDENPYWDELLSQIELVSGKEQVESVEYEADPEITVVTSKGLTFELSDGVTSYAYPEVEGIEYENKDRAAYYIRVLKEEKIRDIFYFDVDEDVYRLRELMQKAMQYEYDKAPAEGIEAVVVRARNDSISKFCAVRSENYGEITLFPEDLDHIIVGDTIRYKLLDEAENTGNINAKIENLTQNDLSASTQSYIKVLPFSYEVLHYKTADIGTFRTDRTELESTYNDWHFILDLLSDKLPVDVYQQLLEKYNADFFENHVIVYCGLQSANVEVTGATQAMEEDAYYPNVISVKELSREAVTDDEEYLLVVAIPKEEWNGNSFDLYLYE